MSEPIMQAWASALRLFSEWLRDLLDDIENMMPTKDDDEHEDT